MWTVMPSPIGDLRVVERGRDCVSCARVVEGGRHRAHGFSLSACRSPSGSAGFRAACAASFGPHTKRKSHQVHARSDGAAGRKPSSIARSRSGCAGRGMRSRRTSAAGWTARRSPRLPRALSPGAGKSSPTPPFPRPAMRRHQPIRLPTRARSPHQSRQHIQTSSTSRLQPAQARRQRISTATFMHSTAPCSTFATACGCRPFSTMPKPGGCRSC